MFAVRWSNAAILSLAFYLQLHLNTEAGGANRVRLLGPVEKKKEPTTGKEALFLERFK